MVCVGVRCFVFAVPGSLSNTCLFFLEETAWIEPLLFLEVSEKHILEDANPSLRFP